jgi:LacI family transcriptional regulator
LLRYGITMKRTTKTVKIDEVARYAGVSSATVSRALNTPDAVKASTRAKIDAAIAKLGYMPNASARALMLGRSETVGAIVPTLDNAIFAKGLEQFQASMSEAGYQLIVASCNYDPVIEERQIKNMLLRGVEAIALFGGSQSSAAIKLLNDRRTPYIHLGTLTPPGNGHACGYDNSTAIQQSVQHLLDLGHRHFGMMAGITKNNDRAAGRVEGVRQRLREHKIPLAPHQIIEVTYDVAAARDGFSTLIKHNPKMTALVCGQDVIAYGAMLQAKQMGITVPEALSVTGFDDLELSQHITPALTTIRYDAKELWGKAAENLLKRIQGTRVAQRLIPSETLLVVRDSTARPKS